MANETTLNMILKLRRDNKFVSSYKLEAGEPGFEISTNTLKIGQYKKDTNGNLTTQLMTWAELPIANKEVIEGLISTAINAHAAGYYTEDEIDGFISDLEDAIDALSDRVTDLETTINGKAAEGGEGAVIGLVDKVEDINDRIGSGFTSTDTVAKAIDDINTAIGDSNDAKNDSTVYGAIAAEADARAQADKAITDAIGATSDTKDKATVYGAIAAEKAAREAAIGTANDASTDSTVYGAIKKVASDLEDAVEELSGADEELSDRIGDVEAKLANVSNVMDFLGTRVVTTTTSEDVTTITVTPENGETFNKGDVVVDNTGKEYVYDGAVWREIGYADANSTAIASLQNEFLANGRVTTAEGKITALENEFKTTGSGESQVKGRIVIAEEEIDDLQSRMGTVEGTVGDHEDVLDDHETRIGNLEDTVNGKGTTKGIYDRAVGKAIELDNSLAAALKGTKATDDTTAETIRGAKDYADAKANAAKDAVVGGDTDTTQAKTVAGAKAFATAAVNQAKNDLIGTDNHTDYASTIGGAKDYAKSIVDDAVDALEDKIDGINVGVTKVSAGTDIVVTPAAGTGDVIVAHKTYNTGTYTKTPTSSSKTGDVYFFDGITTDNGHVTGGTMKSLASILEGMTFIFDGGKSGATGDDAATN